MNKSKLPKKMSTLILLALKDLSKVEKLKGYEINMSRWHTAPDVYRNTKCQVCFAGAVMSQTLKVPKDEDISQVWPYYDKNTAKKFYALNSIRRGKLFAAAYEMNIKLPEGFNGTRRVVRYERNKKRFKLQMRQIARDLKKVGL